MRSCLALGFLLLLNSSFALLPSRAVKSSTHITVHWNKVDRYQGNGYTKVIAMTKVGQEDKEKSIGPVPFLAVLGITTSVSMGITWVTDGGIQCYKMFALAMGIQYIVFLHASGIVFGNAPTERYYDLTGSFTYISMIVHSYLSASVKTSVGTRKKLLSIFVIFWAVRLGAFLVSIIKTAFLHL